MKILEKIRRDIEVANRLWDRNDYLDHISAGNLCMWAGMRFKDLVATKKVTPDEVRQINKLMRESPIARSQQQNVPKDEH